MGLRSVLCLLALSGGGCSLEAAQAPPASAEPRPAAPQAPREVAVRGELVCLLEEVQRNHGVQVAPVHEHLLGVRGEDGELYTVLRTSTSACLFTDPRFRGRALILTGRTFPRSGLLEVIRADWMKDGKVHEVYYWCEVCSIRGVDPGPCACCQGAVELRERPQGGGKESVVPAVPNPPGSADRASLYKEGQER